MSNYHDIMAQRIRAHGDPDNAQRCIQKLDHHLPSSLIADTRRTNVYLELFCENSRIRTVSAFQLSFYLQNLKNPCSNQPYANPDNSLEICLRFDKHELEARSILLLREQDDKYCIVGCIYCDEAWRCRDIL